MYQSNKYIMLQKQIQHVLHIQRNIFLQVQKSVLQVQIKIFQVQKKFLQVQTKILQVQKTILVSSTKKN